MGEGTGETYAEGRVRLTELVAGLTTEEAAAPVPACPEWTVKDVLAHVTGICADVLAGKLDGVATEPWTAAQVEARRQRTLDEVLEEWSTVAPQVEGFADQFPGRVGDQWIFDLTTHEHDVRGALGLPGARDSAGITIGLDFVVTEGFAAGLSARGLSPLEVRAGDRSWVAGAKPDATTGAAVEAPAFEMFRAMAGRRSVAQIAGFTWSGDPAPYLPTFEFGPFTPSSTDLKE